MLLMSPADEVRRLGASRAPDVSESLLERKLEGLRQEVSGDLRRLEDRVRDSSTRSPSLRSAASILQEVNETKRLIWKEYEGLRRDLDYVHQRLRRQEDDLLRHISDEQELKRAQEQSVAVLEKMLSSYEAQTQELERRRADTHSMQRDLLHIRSAIRDLKENARTLEGKVCAPRKRSDRPERCRCGWSQAIGSAVVSSPLGARISLADISSADTSSSFCAAADVSTESRENVVRSGRSHDESEWSDDDDLSDSTAHDDDLSDSTAHDDLSDSAAHDDDLSDSTAHDDDLSDSAAQLSFSDL